MKGADIIETLSDKKEELNQKFAITRLGLFGSYAKGNQREDSDIDILYELQEGAVLGLKELDDLENYLKDLLETERIDLVDKKYINPVIELDIADSVIYV